MNISTTTFRLSANIGTAKQYADSDMTAQELKGKTPQEKGEHYLVLSLKALEELAALLRDERLSDSEKATYSKAYHASMAQCKTMIQLRDRLLTQKKSFRKILVNIFIRSEASRFQKITYRNLSTIRKTSEELHSRLPQLPVWSPVSGSFQDSNVEKAPHNVAEVNDLPPNENPQDTDPNVNTEQGVNETPESNQSLTLVTEEDGYHADENIPPSIPPSDDRQLPLDIESGSLGENDVSVSEESPRDMVEGNVLVQDLPPNETIRGFILSVPAEQGNEVLRTLDQLTALFGEDGGDDDDDNRTITQSTSQSRPPSPSPSLTVVHNINHITINVNNGVFALHSEVTGTAINSGG